MTAIPGKGLHCHHLIAETAKDMARELYAKVMQDNDVYADWKAQCNDITPELAERMFVKMTWPNLVEQARATLAAMLAQPIAEVLKDQISDALIKDNGLKRGRTRINFN